MAVSKFFNEVEKTIYRGPYLDGIACYASFRLDGHVYQVLHDYNEHVTRVFKDCTELKSSPCANGRHSFFTIGGYRPMAHRLVAYCLLEDHTMVYKGYEVNHKTIYRDQIKYNAARREILSDAVEFYDEAEYTMQRLDALVAPVHPLNVEELEWCSKSDNVKHYHFINLHDLYDISISAKDVGMFLARINKQIDVRKLVESYYGI